ncbi:hypothetical protein ACI5KX_11225 [Erythrobacter sp. GH1-10]|uniref:hypothetical protein n=1 Tax=Erythrobacter sp. GH1-10 TaxID=3349334 RepID=UPI003877CE54
MTKAASFRVAGVFSLLALALMLMGSGVILSSKGTAAQDPLEVSSDPATFTAILEAANPALRTALFLDGLFALSYAGAVVFAVLALYDRCPLAAWASGLGIIATMLLDISENLMMMGSLGLAGAGQEITGERIALHVFVSGMKLHLAAFSLVVFTFILPKDGLVTWLMRWGGRTIMPIAAILFVTDAFGMSANASFGVFLAMTGGFALQAILMFREARDQERAG